MALHLGIENLSHLPLEGIPTVTDQPPNTENVMTLNSSTLATFNHDYELNQSESLTFLHNLLYDEKSQLTKGDILLILNSLKERERNLPFSFSSQTSADNQGLRWPHGLRQKFIAERRRMGQLKYFHDLPRSRELAAQVCWHDCTLFLNY